MKAGTGSVQRTNRRRTRIKKKGKILMSIADSNKQEIVPYAEDLIALGYEVYATRGTQHALTAGYVPASLLGNFGEDKPNIDSLIKSGDVALIVNTPTKGRDADRTGFRIRRMAVEYKLPCITSLDTLGALIKALKLNLEGKRYRTNGIE